MRKILLALLAIIVAPTYSQEIGFQEFAYALVSPVEITNAGDSRLFIVELAGTVKIINPDGAPNPTPFLSLPAGTALGGAERGLLGLVFHPQYATNGYFYICYTRDPDGAIIVARYSVDPTNPNIALPNSALQILEIPHPSDSHNGGTLRFGPDGYLYIGVGDGHENPNAQDINTNLGKMLRIDVSNSTQGQPYSIPPGNPYVGIEGNDEIWAVGLRNPWKYSFDSQTNDLWIADVGNYEYEEINHVSSTLAGVNYGWVCYEANNQTTDCASQPTGVTFPVSYYAHASDRCSIIGGFVYRGTLFPDMQNKYIFADMCSNALMMADVTTGQITTSSISLPGGLNFFTTLGQDINGELYIASLSTGIIYKIIDANLGVEGYSSSVLTISPNPAAKDFYVRLKQPDFPASIIVSDLTGKKLMEKKIDSENAPIAIESLQDGVYLVSITANSGTRTTAKIRVAK